MPLHVPVPVQRVPYSGTYNHPNDTDEHDIFEVVVTRALKIADVFLDCASLTQNIIFRLYTKIDGVNYREIDSTRRLTTDRKGFSAVDVTTDKDFKITAQSINAERAVREIPYRYILER